MKSIRLIMTGPLLLLLGFVAAGWLTPGLGLAQGVRITNPQEGQDVRGEIRVQYDGIPEGGYAVINFDGAFKMATAQPFFVLNTLRRDPKPGDEGVGRMADGSHKITVIAMSQAGQKVGQAEVTFNIANSKVAEGAEAVRLVHWEEKDRLDDTVQRYRIFAESNANITGGAKGEGGAAGGGGAGGGPGMAGGAGGGAGGAEPDPIIPAPLDWQVTALVRRVVRDVGMYADSPDGKARAANIRTIVQSAFQHQRDESGYDNAVVKKKKKKKAGKVSPHKGPWLKTWAEAPETGKYFVKMLTASGVATNATRKAPTIALGDLLPVFPEGEVKPGADWQSEMTFLLDLSDRKPTRFSMPMLFTSFENMSTPAGDQRRVAKLESSFNVPQDIAKTLVLGLVAKAGATANTAGAGPGQAQAGPSMAGGAAAGGADTGLTEDDIESAQMRVSRTLWFDVEKHRVLRSEDLIDTTVVVDTSTDEGDAGGGAGAGGPGGAAGGPAAKTGIQYNLHVTTWLDDRTPAPTATFAASGGPAQAHDSTKRRPLTGSLSPQN